MKNLLNRLVPDIAIVIGRFPIPVAICIFMFGLASLEIAEVINFKTRTLESIYFAGFAAFLGSGGSHLFGQGRGLERPATILLALAVAFALAVIVYFKTLFSVSLLTLIPALILWVMIAGFLRKTSTFNAVWLFNSRLALAIILAFIVGGLFAGGLSAIFASLEYLFNVDVDSDTYAHVATAAITIIGPLYGMSLLPLDIDEELQLPRGDDLLNRGISILINYILVPVLLIFVIILHAYAIKIAATFNLPKGQVGIMVLWFGIGGTATWLIARPWVQTGTRFLQVFTRYWFWFTIIPTTLLCLAVYVRINDYGVTPERYGLALVAVWLIALIVYFAIRRIDAKPQFIIGSMAALLFIGSVGPWGAQEFSITSQLSRFDTFMTKWALMKNGKLVAEVPDNVPTSARKQATSIVRYLRRENRLSELSVYFEGSKNNPFLSSDSSFKIAQLIGTRLKLSNTTHQDQVTITHSSYTAGQFSIPMKTTLVGQISVYYNTDTKLTKGNSLSLKNKNFTVKYNDQEWIISQRNILLAFSKLDKKPRTPTQIKIMGSPDITLVITNIQGKFGGKGERINRLSGWLMIPDKN